MCKYNMISEDTTRTFSGSFQPLITVRSSNLRVFKNHRIYWYKLW